MLNIEQARDIKQARKPHAPAEYFGGVALVLLVAGLIYVLLWPLAWEKFHPGPHDWSRHTPSPARRLQIQQEIALALDKGQTRLALSQYNYYREYFVPEDDLAESVAKHLGKRGRLEDAYAVYGAALYYSSLAETGRQPQIWLDYAKLCDQMGLTQEARESRAKADALHAAKQARASQR